MSDTPGDQTRPFGKSRIRIYPGEKDPRSLYDQWKENGHLWVIWLVVGGAAVLLAVVAVLELYFGVKIP